MLRLSLLRNGTNSKLANGPSTVLQLPVDLPSKHDNREFLWLYYFVVTLIALTLVYIVVLLGMIWNRF